MSNAVYDKAMAKVKNRVDGKLVHNEINYLKWTSKPSHVARKMSYNDLVAIPCYHDIRVTVNLD